MGIYFSVIVLRSVGFPPIVIAKTLLAARVDRYTKVDRQRESAWIVRALVCA